jgi:hypothetical protein
LRFWDSRFFGSSYGGKTRCCPWLEATGAGVAGVGVACAAGAAGVAAGGGGVVQAPSKLASSALMRIRFIVVSPYSFITCPVTGFVSLLITNAQDRFSFHRKKLGYLA